jgi:tetratricopeptide (TPR) repeat protein
LIFALLTSWALVLGADLRQALPDMAARSPMPEATSTDARIRQLQKLLALNPASTLFQNQLARAYLQKLRETVDFDYLERADGLLNRVLAVDDGNYEALRLREVGQLERHHFQTAGEFAETLIRLHPGDPWNYGVLGDASMEMGRYDRAAAAYHRMLELRPDQSSLNRAGWYAFVAGHPDEAVALMTEAVASGARSPENTAWCLVDLGNIYFKTGHLELPNEATGRPQRPSPDITRRKPDWGAWPAPTAATPKPLPCTGRRKPQCPCPNMRPRSNSCTRC